MSTGNIIMVGSLFLLIFGEPMSIHWFGQMQEMKDHNHHCINIYQYHYWMRLNKSSLFRNV